MHGSSPRLVHVERKNWKKRRRCWTGPDFQKVVRRYGSRCGHAELDPGYATLHNRFESTRTLNVPTLLLHGVEDNCDLAETTDGAEQHFTGGYRRGLLGGVGHLPQREEPEATAEAILQHISQYE
jgi:pimeloyl-ACP methyl ester carboxylesterase